MINSAYIMAKVKIGNIYLKFNLLMLKLLLGNSSKYIWEAFALILYYNLNLNWPSLSFKNGKFINLILKKIYFLNIYCVLY